MLPEVWWLMLANHTFRGHHLHTLNVPRDTNNKHQTSTLQTSGRYPEKLTHDMSLTHTDFAHADELTRCVA